MGFETYLVEVRLINLNDKSDFVTDLLTNQFKLIQSDQNIYLEKTYATGIVEICISQTQIYFRYAKPNLKQSLLEFLQELQSLSLKYDMVLYDCFSKKEYKREHFLEILDYFEESHKEFLSYYSSDAFPVRSADVFKNTSK